MMNSIFRLENIEIHSTETNNYLLIHKCGCSQVRSHLLQNSKNTTRSRILPNTNPYWTVIRDPYQRFISGLTYDIINSFGDLNSLDKILTEKRISSLFFKSPNEILLNSRDVNHTKLQWTYIFNQPLHFFVNLDDLDLFLDIHFPQRINNPNRQNKEHKDIVSNYINNRPKLKNIINNFLANDYYLIENLKSYGLIWEWEFGKMF